MVIKVSSLLSSKLSRAGGTLAPGSTTVAIPLGNSAPLVTQGEQAWSNTFTPMINTSVVYIRCNCVVDAGTNGRAIVLALFRDSTCIFSTITSIQTSGTGTNVSIAFTDVPATTSPIVYQLRIGPALDGTMVHWASNHEGDTMGGTFAGQYTIEEKR